MSNTPKCDLESASIAALAPLYPPRGFAIDGWELFKSRQSEYLTRCLERKWACSEKGHKLCVPTQDGKHHQFVEEQISLWLDAMRKETPNITTSQPPKACFILEAQTDTLKASLMEQPGSFTAITPPSENQDIRWKSLAKMASIRRAIQPSNTLSGVIGYIAAPFGTTARLVAHTTEDLLVWSRMRDARKFVSRMRWSVYGVPDHIVEERLEALCRILDKLLELSRECYSYDIRRCVLAIAKKANEGPNRPEPYQPLVSVFTSYMEHTIPQTLPQDALDDICRGLKNIITHPMARAGTPAATTIFINALSNHLLYNPCHPDSTHILFTLKYFVSQEWSNGRKLNEEDLETLETLVEFLVKPYHSEKILALWEARIYLLDICVGCIPQKKNFKLVVRGPDGIDYIINHLEAILSASNNEDDGLVIPFMAVKFLRECSEQKSLSDLTTIWGNVIGLMLSILKKLPMTSSRFQTDKLHYNLSVVLEALRSIHILVVKHPEYEYDEARLLQDAYSTIQDIAAIDPEPFLLKVKPKEKEEPPTPSELDRRRRKRPTNKLIREEIHEKRASPKRTWDCEVVERRNVVTSIIITAKEIASALKRKSLLRTV